MIVNTAHCIFAFVSFYISAYLLTAFVDFKSRGRAVRLNKAWARILFTFYKSEEYNVSSVCMQSANYLFTLIFLVGNLTHAERYLHEYVQAAIVAGIFASALLATTVCNSVLSRKYKFENEEVVENDR